MQGFVTVYFLIKIKVQCETAISLNLASCVADVVRSADSELQKMISNEELEKVFAYSNFGDSTKRDVVRYALMKVACG